jgi:hypothetical protein
MSQDKKERLEHERKKDVFILLWSTNSKERSIEGGLSMPLNKIELNITMISLFWSVLLIKQSGDLEE